MKSLVADNEPPAVGLRGRAALMHRLEARFRFLAVSAACVATAHLHACHPGLPWALLLPCCCRCWPARWCAASKKQRKSRAGGLVGCDPWTPPQLPGGAAVPARPPVSQVPWRAGHCGACPSVTTPSWREAGTDLLQLRADLHSVLEFTYRCTQLLICPCSPHSTLAWVLLCMSKPFSLSIESASFASYVRRTWRQRSSCISCSATRQASLTRAQMPARLPLMRAARRR